MTQEWRAPDFGFTVEWPVAVLETVRAEAQDGFFALPHGGLEAGGVLWGTHRSGRVRILAVRPLACEHARGPAFTLSANDHTRLATMLAEGPEGMQPVGWYHSHTRSDLCLSPADVEIHNRYFPKPWQVALVVRPHAIDPMRAGFFFREKDGSMHAESSYEEFVLQPTVAAAAPTPAPAPELKERPPNRVRLPDHRLRGLVWAILALAAAVAAFAVRGGYRPDAPWLMTYDLDGQLEIRWQADASAGKLEISDGADRTILDLDRRQLLAGALTYVRQSPRVDVHLMLRDRRGAAHEAFATFLGQGGANVQGSGPEAISHAARRALAKSAP